MEAKMSKITKWEPFNELISMRRDMDRMFDDFFSRPMTMQPGWNMPTIDMYQTDDEVVIKATIPGISPEDLDIQITGDTLTLQGEIKHEEKVENAKYHIREHSYQSFSRSLTLPVQVVADKANAEINNGILTLTLPKAEEVKPKVISVKAK
jgi:HSP20 family protein